MAFIYFSCEPFKKLMKSSKTVEAKAEHKVCPDLTSINSIVKLNSTTGLMFRTGFYFFLFFKLFTKRTHLIHAK